MINQTYGQSGQRRGIFLTSFYYFITDVQISKYKNKHKLDFNKFSKVPIPHEFYEHILNCQLKNEFVTDSDEILSIYNNII